MPRSDHRETLRSDPAPEGALFVFRRRHRSVQLVLNILREIAASARDASGLPIVLAKRDFDRRECELVCRLVDNIAATGARIAEPGMGYVSAFENSLVGALADRQRKPHRQYGLPIPAGLDEALLERCATVLRDRGYMVAHSAILSVQDNH